LKGALIPAVLAVLWEAGSRAGVLPQDSFSRPTAIAGAFVQGFADGTIPRDTWLTFEAALAGFAIAAVLGILGGVALGLSARLERIVGPSVDALRPIPSVALIPLALLVFGFGVRMEATVVAFACFWPVLLMTQSAVRGIEPRLLELARSLQLSFVGTLCKVILPAARSRIGVGLRLALGISLVVAVTVEIVLNPRGLGHAMIGAQQALRSDLMYAQLLWLGAVGWLFNHAAKKVLP
jgi:ABC-type nitrate/sulfonate/bicarbonate transport system permease component